MRILFVNGSMVHFTPRELLQMFGHRLMVGALLTAFAVVIWSEPFDDVAQMRGAVAVVHWALVLSTTFGVYLATLLAVGLRFRTGYSLLAHLAAATFCALFAPTLGQAFGLAPISVWDVTLSFGFTLVVSLTCELVCASFLLRRVLAELKLSATAPGALPTFADVDNTSALATDRSGEADSVVLLGNRFGLADLQLISSDEHYVHIVTAAGRRMLRGRISDIEAQLPAAWGLRVHRSHWVATAAARALRRGRDGWSLVLADGSEVPVARARREAVREWAESNGFGST